MSSNHRHQNIVKILVKYKSFCGRIVLYKYVFSLYWNSKYTGTVCHKKYKVKDIRLYLKRHIGTKQQT